MLDGTIRLAAFVTGDGLVHLIRGHLNGEYVDYKDSKGQIYSLCYEHYAGLVLVETATCIECLAVCNE